VGDRSKKKEKKKTDGRIDRSIDRCLVVDIVVVDRAEKGDEKDNIGMMELLPRDRKIDRYMLGQNAIVIIVILTA
jgi:hypothetical protein